MRGKSEREKERVMTRKSRAAQEYFGTDEQVWGLFV